MADATPEEILNAIKKLTPEQRHWLRETLAAGTRKPAEQLHNQAANPAENEPSDNQLHDSAAETGHNPDAPFGGEA